ncbi:5'-nucleotidase C-terminal domain-containing protein, partial [Myxococcota bacterium]|nr:5'-nucleotidase C-terminal domain-containing protein [Myxococcota bacterium]
PITEEMMYNVFPFENTITTLTVSGAEVKTLLDYVTLRSARRGCSAQAQVAGVTFVMNCNDHVVPPFKDAGSFETAHRVTIGGARLTDPNRYGVDSDGKAVCQYDGVTCNSGGTPGDPDTCMDTIEPVKSCPAGTEFGAGGCCPAGELCTPLGCGRPITMLSSYTLAANDYIAQGGSGFRVLQFNTTQFNTGIPLRDSVVDFLYINYPGCGVDLTSTEIDELNALIEAASTQTLAQFDGANKTFMNYVDSMKDKDFTRYASCTEDLGVQMKKDCEALPNNTDEKDRCKIQQLVIAAQICIDIPCVEAKEDGRMDRIFPQSE